MNTAERIAGWQQRLRAAAARPAVASGLRAPPACAPSPPPPVLPPPPLPPPLLSLPLRQRVAVQRCASLPGSGGGSGSISESRPQLLRQPQQADADADDGGSSSTTTSSSTTAATKAIAEAVAAAPDAAALAALLPTVAAAQRPHLTALAWERLAQVAAASSGGPDGQKRRQWGGGGGDGAAAAAVATEALFAELCDLTSQQCGALQFAQLAALFASWSRLAALAGAPPLPPRLLAAVAARAGACPTEQEEWRRAPTAAADAARLARGAGALRVQCDSLWRKAARLAAACAPDMDAQQVARAMWGLARGRALQGAAADALCGRVAELAPAAFRPSDVADAVWALGASQAARPAARRGALEALAAAAVHAHAQLSPAEASSVAWGFARASQPLRRQQLPGRRALLDALAAAAAAGADRMSALQAATTAWALAVLASKDPLAERLGGGGAAGAAPVRALAARRLLACAARAFDPSTATLGQVCMMTYVAAKPPRGGRNGGSGGGSDGADVEHEETVQEVMRLAADWALRAPADALPADGVAALLWAFHRSGFLASPGAAGAAAALAARAAALARASRFPPARAVRAAAALGALASRGGGSGPAAEAADAAHAALDALALQLAAAAGRLRLKALADVACGYAAAGAYDEDLMDAISEVSAGAIPSHPLCCCVVFSACGSCALRPLPANTPPPSTPLLACTHPTQNRPRSARARSARRARGSARACCGRSPRSATPTRASLTP